LPRSGVDDEEAASWEEAWRSEAWLRALSLFLRRVYASAAELSEAMLGVVGAVHRAAGLGGAGVEAGERPWLHALGVAGLMLEQLRSARPALAAAADFSLRDLLDSLIQPALRHRSAKVGVGVYECALDGEEGQGG
jgi:hypothetical protein